MTRVEGKQVLTKTIKGLKREKKLLEKLQGLVLDTNLLHHFILRLKQGFMTYKCEKSE
jgi:hypothetical protein